MTAELRDKLDEALERIRQLEEDLKPSKLMHYFPLSWGLAFREASILAMLVARSPEPMTREMIFRRAWDERSEVLDDKIVDIYLSKIRVALKRNSLAVTIRHHGRQLGWSFSSDDAKLLRAICDAERSGWTSSAEMKIVDVIDGPAGYIACAGSIVSRKQVELTIEHLLNCADRLWPVEERKRA